MVLQKGFSALIDVDWLSLLLDVIHTAALNGLKDSNPDHFYLQKQKTMMTAKSVKGMLTEFVQNSTFLKANAYFFFQCKTLQQTKNNGFGKAILVLISNCYC